MAYTTPETILFLWQKMNNIAIILARQGSKSIPLKNLIPLNGKSLLARTILAARDSKIFNHIIVSTDGELIAQEAKSYGATVITRPANLATDTASSISGVLHVLNTLQRTNGICCLLQPTSPLRTYQHIQEAYSLFIQQQSGSVISATECHHHPYKTLIMHETQYIPTHQLSDLESPRQTLPKAYQPNGAIYFNHIEELLQHKRFFIEPLHLYLMNQEDSIDIDKPSDIHIAEQLIQRREQCYEQ